MAPILYIANFDPRAGAYFFAFIGAVIIILNYEIIEKLFSQKIAIISSFLIAISPAWVALTREARFFSLTAFFFYPFIYFLVQSINSLQKPSIIKKSRKLLFLTGLFLGIMLNFHWTPLALLPPIALLLFWNKKRLSKTIIISGIIGLIIPNLPFLISTFLNKLTMLVKLTTWLPYRIVGFIGLYPKNTISLEVIRQNLSSLIIFFRTNLITNINLLSISIVLITFVFIILKCKIELKKNKKDWTFITLVTLLFGLYIALFIHGDPPAHYYVAIFPLPIIFFSILLERIQLNKVISTLFTLVLITITFANLRNYFTGNWFNSTDNWSFEKGLVPYKLQLQTTQQIIKDAAGNKFQLRRVGPSDHFKGNYAQNYQYLLWWMGNEPVAKADLIYTIYEDPSQMPSFHKGKVFLMNNIAILKEEVDFEKLESQWKKSRQ